MKRILIAVAAVAAVALAGTVVAYNTSPAFAQAVQAIAVQGSQAEGVTYTKPPVSIGLKDQNTKLRGISGTAYGAAEVTGDSRKAASYRFSASFTPQPTAAVTLASVQGSATKTVRVKRVILCGHSTANAQEIIALQRTSALGAGGTTVAPTAGKMDTTLASAAATAVVQHYTATLKAAGTPVGGPLSTQDFWTGVVTTPTVYTPCQQIFPEAGGPPNQAIVLRGVAEFLEIQSINAGNLSAGTVLQYVIEEEEES